MEPASSWMLVGLVTTEPQGELPHCSILRGNFQVGTIMYGKSMEEVSLGNESGCEQGSQTAPPTPTPGQDRRAHHLLELSGPRLRAFRVPSQQMPALLWQDEGVVHAEVSRGRRQHEKTMGFLSKGSYSLLS